nr:hypothetical protein [Zobellia laminariae]
MHGANLGCILKIQKRTFLNDGKFRELKICIIFASQFDIGNAGVVELVDTLDLGIRQEKVIKILKMQAWWNW